MEPRSPKASKNTKESASYSGKAEKAAAHPSAFFPALPGDLVQLVGSYAQGGSAQPAVWTNGQPTTWAIEDKEAKEQNITEVQFRTGEGFLEYTLKDQSGKIIHDFISLKTLEAHEVEIKKLEPLERKKPEEERKDLELTQKIQRYQATLEQYWPRLAKILSARGQIRYDMKEANALSAAANNPDSNLKKQLVDHVVWLLEIGRRDEAIEMLQSNPKLLLERSKGVTPYQYALCTKDIRAVKMIGRCFDLGPLDATLKEAKLAQAIEYQSGENSKVEALRVHFEEVKQKTQIAYQFYIRNFDDWTLELERDYWCRVIGRLQNEWPAHWRQELCYPDRNFDGTTEFTFEGVLPEAKFWNDTPWLPGRDDGGEINLRIVPPGTPLNSIKEALDKPTLIKQGQHYSIYVPQIPEDKELNKVVEWKAIALPEEIIDKQLNSLRVALLDEAKSEAKKAYLKKEAEESNTAMILNQEGGLSLYSRNEDGHWRESELDGYDEKIIRAGLSVTEEDITALSKERNLDLFKFIKKHHLPIAFPWAGQEKDLFISPLRHHVLYEAVVSLGSLVSLGVGSGIDFATYNYARGCSRPGARPEGVGPQRVGNFAGITGLYEAETHELNAELETTLQQAKKLSR
jgi:hypothetical protein